MNEIIKRVRGSLMVLGIALFAMTGLAATNDVSGMLQKGLFEEEANRNLDAAIQAYQSVIAQTDKERKFAATAIFRLGECYRKLGKTNEATAQYERIVREFSDQTELVKLSQGNIGTSQKTSAATGNFAERLQSIAKNPEDYKIEEIQKMIKDSPDLINTPVRGAAPLNQAVDEGQLKVVKFLLDNGANIEAIDTQTGRTPLIEASQRGNKSMVALLLEHGANVNAMQRQVQSTMNYKPHPPAEEVGYTPLHHAAVNGYRAIAEELIAHKANVNAKSQNGKTPLHLAAEKGFKSVAELLLANGAEINLADNSGFTPLHSAVNAKNKAIVELLLANKADVNSKSVAGETPLILSAYNEDAEIAQMLLAHNADIHASTRNGWTPLMPAVMYSNKQLVETLLSKGMDVNAQSQEHHTALGLAIGRSDMTALVLKYKPQLEVVDRDGFTPLQKAIRYNYIKDAELLLNAGANGNTPFKDGFFPLLLAVNQRNNEMIELLLAHNVDVNQQDNGGGTAISYAKQLQASSQNNPVESEKLEKIIEVLRKAGANENLRRLAAIGISREDFRKEIFSKGTNAYNNYTLFELIARAYTPEAWANNWIARTMEPPGLRFPDFTKITINRLEEDGRTNILKLNLEVPLTSGDCSKDIPLKWGDIVEIPELDHSVTEQWSGLPDKVAETLVKCLERTVTIIVKGKPTNVFLFPNLFPTYRNSSTFGGAAFATPTGIRLSTFWLPNVVSDANVLLASSDLTRVKVKRTDSVTKQSKEFVFDLKASVERRQSPQNKKRKVFSVNGVSREEFIDDAEPYMLAFNLWLRDGDVIEIPEKQ